MTTHETQVFKVTDLLDRSCSFSWWDDRLIAEERVQYSTSEWATALPHSGLFCFSNLEDAEAFAEIMYTRMKIWTAIARRPRGHSHIRMRHMPYRTRREVISNWKSDFHPFRVSPWPKGTVTFRQVKLVRLHGIYPYPTSTTKEHHT